MKTNPAELLKDLIESGYVEEYFASQFPDLRLEPRRTNYSVHCPFHDDNTASMSIDTEGGLFICHTGCAQGSVFDFRMKEEDITLAEAVARFASELAAYIKKDKQRPAAEKKPNPPKAAVQQVTIDDTRRWHQQLFDDPENAEILKGLYARGLTKETLVKFQVGADTDLFSKGTVQGRCLVIPILDGGKVISVKKVLHKDGERHFKTIGRSKVLLNIDALNTSGERVFICEGETDCMRLVQDGLLAVTSCGGALSWAEDWKTYFQDRDVILVFDSDKAGRNGANKVSTLLVKVARSMKNVDLFPNTTDKLKKDVTDFFTTGQSLRDFLDIVEQTPYVTTGDTVSKDASLIDLIDNRVMDSDNKFRRNEDIAEIIFTWIENNDGLFFRDRRNNVYLVINGQHVLVDFTDRAFESYLFSIARITSGDIKGRVIVKGIQALGLERGKLVSESAFLQSDPKHNILWVNPSLETSDLLRITADGIAVVPNGTNKENIFLLKAGMMKPLNFVRLASNQLKDALLSIENLVLAHLACAETDRWFVLMWALSFLLKDFVKTRPLMRFEGISSGGKSTGVELLTALIYGADQKAIATLAAQYSEGTTNPILFLDNIERRNLGSGEYDFLLTSSTGISKLKRRQGTDTEVVTETPRCLVLTTGIENLFGQEIINRSLIVEFDRTKYGSDLTERVFHQIVAERSVLMSALFHLQARILDRISSGDWDQLQEMLKGDFPRHSKERANAYLALMLLLFDEWCDITGRPYGARTTARQWISRQDLASRAVGIESNPIIQYLDLLVSTRMRMTRSSFDDDKPPVWDYPLSMPSIIDHDVEKKKAVPTRIVFQGFASDLHLTFMQLMKGMNPGYIFRDARQLAARIKDGMSELKADGWEVKRGHRRKGRTVWKFEKVIESSYLSPQEWEEAGGNDQGMIGNDQNDNRSTE